MQEALPCCLREGFVCFGLFFSSFIGTIITYSGQYKRILGGKYCFKIIFALHLWCFQQKREGCGASRLDKQAHIWVNCSPLHLSTWKSMCPLWSSSSQKDRYGSRLCCWGFFFPSFLLIDFSPHLFSQNFAFLVFVPMVTHMKNLLTARFYYSTFPCR